MWSFQGWAFINWETVKQGSFIKRFVDAVPKDRFVVIDMSQNGEGELHKWNDAAFLVLDLYGLRCMTLEETME